MELIDYVEAQGLANFAWQEASNAITRQEANLTLGFLLAGGGAALAWSISQAAQADGNHALAAAVFVLGAWLFTLAALVQLRCLPFSTSMPPANQPCHLYLPQFNTLSVREIQLGHLDAAILTAIERGQIRAKRLVRLRLLTCLSPVVFLVAWAVSHAVLP